MPHGTSSWILREPVDPPVRCAPKLVLTPPEVGVIVDRSNSRFDTERSKNPQRSEWRQQMPGRGDHNGRRPTIRDVAARAGVSKSLVSLVMRDEPMVREEKRRRVQQAADELGYRMNLAARSLSDSRSKTVGVLVADLRNPLLVDVVERAGQVLEENGYS